MLEKQSFTADSATIRANIRRIWGSPEAAEEATGIVAKTWYNLINSGEVTDYLAGGLFKRGIDPAELVRPIEEKRA